jgi:DedD protein
LEYRLSTPFQNRLVGTIIVAAAIIIFLPDILDGEKKSNQADFEAIPKAPTFTGKMTKKSFPTEDLVLKEKATVYNEEAKDEQLQTNTIKNDENINNEDGLIINNKAKVTPATKEQNIVNTADSVVKSSSAIEKPTLGQQPSKALNKVAWVIQLGSFKHKSNVSELVEKLRDNGYTVFTKPIQTKKGTLTKVFVGPELIKASLTNKLPALKSLTNVQGKVARFYPTK